MSREYYNDVADLTHNGMTEPLAMLLMDRFHLQDEKNKDRFPTFQDMEAAILQSEQRIMKSIYWTGFFQVIVIMITIFVAIIVK